MGVHWLCDLSCSANPSCPRLEQSGAKDELYVPILFPIVKFTQPFRASEGDLARHRHIPARPMRPHPEGDPPRATIPRQVVQDEARPALAGPRCLSAPRPPQPSQVDPHGLLQEDAGAGALDPGSRVLMPARPSARVRSRP